MNFILYIVAALAGAPNAVQDDANPQLRKSIDQPLLAGMTVYLTRSSPFGCAAFAPAFGHPGSFQWSKPHPVPWRAWLGVLLSIGSKMPGCALPLGGLLPATRF